MNAIVNVYVNSEFLVRFANQLIQKLCGIKEMKFSSYIVIYLLIGFCFQSSATTWLVGPSRTYTMPSQVSTLVQNGDTVLIDAAVYNSDVARWSAHNLVLQGTGGMAHLKANGNTYGGKAIWVIAGNNTTVDSIEFSLAACVDQNGAGIRQEGVNLTVRHCYFHDNEEGILAGDNVTSDILIEFSEFDNNGYGDGYSHNLYINHVNSLTFQYNYSHRAHVGHELKSRAYNNYIFYNRIANETGDASREIDIPNGGIAIIIGNEIEQGINTQNSNIIGFGLEGLTNPSPHNLYVVNNTIVNDRPTGIFISVQTGIALYKLYNNIFAGTGTVITGNAALVDTSHNIHTSIAAAGLVDAANFDYHLLASSPAVNNAVNPGFANSISLYPFNEYMHVADSVSRAVSGLLDVGAHEFETPSGIESKLGNAMMLYPNPAHSRFILLINGMIQAENSMIQIFDCTGRCAYKKEIGNGKHEIIDAGLLPGIYFVEVRETLQGGVDVYAGEQRMIQKLIIE
jgi:hypothetical protein